LKGALDLIVVLLLGLGLGGALSWATIRTDQGIGAANVGQWTSWPSSGRPDSDPYTKARVAAGGEIPLGAAEGLSFLILADDAGGKLRPQCRYRLQGQTPPARLWTLTYQQLDDSASQAVATDASVLTSGEMLREQNGSIDVAIGPDLSPGDWLKTSGAGFFIVLMRFYDTPLTGTGALDGIDMPTIKRVAC